jgi:hypothetical protein
MTLKTARMFNWKCARVAHSSLSPLHDVKSPILYVIGADGPVILSRSEAEAKNLVACIENASYTQNENSAKCHLCQDCGGDISSGIRSG